MANRRFEQFRYSLEKAVVELFGKFSVGASGAPTLTESMSKGIASVARNSAGKYTITLEDKYQRLMDFHASLVVSSGAPASSSNVQVVVRTDGSASTTPTIVVEVLDNAGAAIELANGVVVLFKATLKNSTV